MRLALIGYGAMGQLIAQQARAANDEIGETFTSKEAGLSTEDRAKRLSGHDVAVDFSNGSAECAARPSVLSTNRREPLVATASLLSVGSPLIM